MINPVPMLIGLKDSPRNAFHAPELSDDAQLVLAAQVITYVVIMYLCFVHNLLILLINAAWLLFLVTCQLHGFTVYTH